MSISLCKMMALTALLLPLSLRAIQVPAGTELSIRFTDKVATETTQTHAAIHAVLIAPVILDGRIALPAGAQLTGEVREINAAVDKEQARLQIAFTQIREGSYGANLSAVVSGLDNARESIDDKGVITGINGSDTFSARIDQGINKLQSSDRFATFAGLIEGAKEALKIEDANANIDFDPGVEMTLKLTEALEWRGPTDGPEAKLLPFPDQAGLIDMVARQPFRTVAENPPRPSDVTNLMFLATEDELRSAFEKAGWSTAAHLNTQSKLETARALIEARGYKEGPMSVLLLDGSAPDFSWQKGNNTFAQRHHLRIFRRPGTFDGKPIWVCSATHDIGIDFSERDRTFIHKINPDIDKERAKVVDDLLFTGLIRSLALVDRPAIPANATNATGDPIQTDSRMAVLLFQ